MRDLKPFIGGAKQLPSDLQFSFQDASAHNTWMVDCIAEFHSVPSTACYLGGEGVGGVDGLGVVVLSFQESFQQVRVYAGSSLPPCSSPFINSLNEPCLQPSNSNKQIQRKFEIERLLDIALKLIKIQRSTRFTKGSIVSQALCGPTFKVWDF